jgi:FkbM family methyltransferase
MALTLDEYEKLNPRCELSYQGLAIVFATPSLFTKWRVDSLFEKEPWTLDWIATFGPGEVFLDVGANVGMYTIWAAMTRRVPVYAFEPEAQNYALLNRNLLLNRLDGQVKAYCVGLSDIAAFTELHLTDLRAGGSCHSVGEKVDFKHQPTAPAFSQGCVTARLDDLVAEHVLPVPAHIKIDVDGFESKVIRGATSTLANRALRSLLVEVNQNLDDHQAMVRTLEEFGFRHDPDQVARAQRKSGIFKGVAEYVFVR